LLRKTDCQLIAAQLIRLFAVCGNALPDLGTAGWTRTTDLLIHSQAL
jgi:hypothetical protein